MSFTFGPTARSWLVMLGVPSDRMPDLERAVDLDLSVQRLSRPLRVPSEAAILRRRARQLESLARRTKGR